MKSIKLAYSEILSKILSRQKVDNPEQTGMLPDNIQQQIDNDTNCSIKLLERGYSIDEIIEVLKKHSPSVKRLDAKAITTYVDNVTKSINKEWTHHAESSYKEAVQTYKSRAHTMLSKYKDYDDSHFGIFHDGSIAITMLMDDGYPLALVNQVLRRNSICKNTNESYFNQLEDSLKAVKERYERIMRFNPEQDVTDTNTMYLKFAHKRLEECQSRLFSGQDEQKIIESLHDKIFANEKLMANHDAVMEQVFNPAIREAIKENSPIYIEPGRNKEEYLKSVLEDFMASYKAKALQSEQNYTLTEKYYRQQQELEDQNINEFMYLHTNSIIDSTIVKNLLEEHHSVENIKKAIMLNSKTENKDEKYADLILSRAQDSLHAEKEIQNFELATISTDVSDVKSTEMTVTMLLKQMLKERITAYPSFALELSKPSADRDAVEKLLKRFPDCDKDELKKAILEVSPRARLLGDKNYADKVLKLVDERIKKLQKRNEVKNEFEIKYNKLRGLANEGVQSDNPMNSLKDGRIAVKMLRQGISQDDVKEFLTTIAKGAALVTPAVYATTILAKATATLAREQDIANFAGISADAPEITCADAYTEKMQRQYQKTGIVKTGMDVETVRQLILEEHYSKNEIKEIVLTRSPNASEPGRDESYAEYIEKMAQEEIDREKEKLKRYVPTPRLEHEEDIKKEYDYQKRELMRLIRLPFCIAMDALIGQALLSEGFTALEIARTMNENSPLLNPEQDINRTDMLGDRENSIYSPTRSNFALGDYGQQVLKVIKETTETITEERSEDRVLSRTRTIEENIHKVVEDS